MKVFRVALCIAVIGFISILFSCQKSKEVNENIRVESKRIKINPHNIKALYHRGNGYLHKENYKKAIKDFSKAIELDPEMVCAHLARGYAYLVIEEYEKALSDLNLVYNSAKDDPVLFAVFTCRGYVYKKIGNYNKAIEEYRRAFKIDPQYVEIDIKKALAKALEKLEEDFSK